MATPVLQGSLPSSILLQSPSHRHCRQAAHCTTDQSLRLHSRQSSFCGRSTPLQQSAPPAPRCGRQLAASPSADAAVAEKPPTKPAQGIDWDKLGFGLDHVGSKQFRVTWTEQDGWRGGLEDYGPLSLMPSSQALNYGQAIFEGLKAQRSASGRIVLFRLDRNAQRMQDGAARMLMPAPPADLFATAVMQVVEANQDLVPPLGKGSLYVRPLLLGSGALLGLGPAPSYTFVVYAAAVGAYFKGGQLDPIDLLVEERFHRAAPGGNGGVKAAGNYSPVLRLQAEAKRQGYSDVVYLDAKTDTYLEEVSSCNIFTVSGKTIRTPALHGTILPGVTRGAIIELARSKGYTVEETDVPIQEAIQADEVFTSGTAVVVCSVGSITYKGQRRQYGEKGQPGPVTLELYEALTAIQQERAPDDFGWVVPVVGKA